MPIQFPNFERISFEEANPWMMGAQAGQQFAQNSMMFPQAIQAKILANQIAEMQAKKAAAELPYAGITAKSTADYKTAMAKYLSNPFQMQRFLSPTGKLLNEQQMLGGSGNPITGGIDEDNVTNKNVHDIYGRKILKESTDTNARNRNLFSSNIEKTVQNINPADLTEYSGVSGFGKHAMDMLSNLISGKTPDRMAKQAVASQNAEALATQVRQFYGASITPEQIKELNKLTNPSSFLYDQETAMKIYAKYTKLLGTEMETYRKAMKSPDIYTGKKAINQTPKGKVEEVKNFKGKRYVKINGGWLE